MMKTTNNWIKRGIRYGLIGSSLVLTYVLILINTGVNTLAMHTFGKLFLIGALMFFGMSRIHDEMHQLNIRQVLRNTFFAGVIMAISLVSVEMILQNAFGLILAPDFIVNADITHMALYPVFAIELMVYSFFGGFLGYQYYKNPEAIRMKELKNKTT